LKPGPAVLVAGAALLLAAAAWWRGAPGGDPSAAPAGPGGWLRGDAGAKFDRLAAQQRGFDSAMWEVGQRFLELDWAATQQDWGYARYQTGKIRHVIELALERRPKRADSARAFLTEGLTPLEALLQPDVAPDPARFAAARDAMLAACVTCHAREQAPLRNLPAWFAIRRLPASP
jgi:cytochrome c553